MSEPTTTPEQDNAWTQAALAAMEGGNCALLGLLLSQWPPGQLHQARPPQPHAPAQRLLGEWASTELALPSRWSASVSQALWDLLQQHGIRQWTDVPGRGNKPSWYGFFQSFSRMGQEDAAQAHVRLVQSLRRLHEAGMDLTLGWKKQPLMHHLMAHGDWAWAHALWEVLPSPSQHLDKKGQSPLQALIDNRHLFNSLQKDARHHAAFEGWLARTPVTWWTQPNAKGLSFAEALHVLVPPSIGATIQRYILQDRLVESDTAPRRGPRL